MSDSPPLPAPHTPREPDVVTDDAFNVAYASQVQEHAQPHMPKMVDVLVELATGRRNGGTGAANTVNTTPATRRGSARDIIDLGHPHSLGKQADLERALEGGVHITIVSQSGEVLEVRTAAQRPPPIDINPVVDDGGDDILDAEIIPQG